MWQGSYWPAEYWASQYWAKVGAQPVGGAAVAGIPARRILLNAIAVEEYTRSLLDEANMRAVMQAAARRAANGVWLRKLEADYQRKCLEWAAFSVVLTEI